MSNIPTTLSLTLSGKKYLFKDGQWMVDNSFLGEEEKLDEKIKQLKIEQSDLNLKINIALKMVYF
jgi:hypothetical protein